MIVQAEVTAMKTEHEMQRDELNEQACLYSQKNWSSNNCSVMRKRHIHQRAKVSVVDGEIFYRREKAR